MNCLIIGFGSIGQRHADVLASQGHRVSVLSRHSNSADYPIHRNLDEAFQDGLPDYVVVANPTSDHEQTLHHLIEHEFSGKLLMEKPLFIHAAPLPGHNFSSVHVGYNLRFHPILSRLKELLKGQSLRALHIHAGSYLPHWRPNTDYTRSSSSIRDQGGGVLRDLSHELDYLLWLTGQWIQVTARGGTFGNLAISSEDTYSLLVETEKCPLATINLSYLERVPHRTIVAICDETTITADLIDGSIRTDRTLNFQEKAVVERNDTYILQHKSILEKATTPACTLEQGLAVNQLIDAAEKAAQERIWITR